MTPTPNIEELIQQAAAQYNLPPERLRALLVAESNLNPNAVSPKGAQGIAQFMPGTAKGLGIDPLDPTQAIPASAMYVRQQLNAFGGDWDRALAAYNWGPGNVSRFGMSNLPGETQRYIAKVKGGPFQAPVNLDRPPAPAPAPQQPSSLAQTVTPASTPQPQGPDPAVMMSMLRGNSLADMLLRAGKNLGQQNDVTGYV